MRVQIEQRYSNWDRAATETILQFYPAKHTWAGYSQDIKVNRNYNNNCIQIIVQLKEDWNCTEVTWSNILIFHLINDCSDLMRLGGWRAGRREGVRELGRREGGGGREGNGCWQERPLGSRASSPSPRLTCTHCRVYQFICWTHINTHFDLSGLSDNGVLKHYKAPYVHMHHLINLIHRI